MVVLIPESKKYDTNAESRQLMNMILSDAYDLEWQRTRDIESKACNIVGFTGIIFTLIIGTLSSFLVNDKGIIVGSMLFSSQHSKYAIIIVLSLMVISMIFGLFALSIRKWKYPIVSDIMATYEKSLNNSILKEELLGTMNKTYLSCIQKNETFNDTMVICVQISHICFIISIILIAVYFLYTMIIFY